MYVHVHVSFMAERKYHYFIPIRIITLRVKDRTARVIIWRVTSIHKMFYIQKNPPKNNWYVRQK